MRTLKIIFVVIFLLNSSCGYKPIYMKNNELVLEFNNIITIGDEKLNDKIINAVGITENQANNKLNELIVRSSFNIEETSKNSKGQVITYRSIINVQLTIKNNEKIIKNKNFINEFSYNNKNNKFELTQYQNEIKNNLINKSSEEILLFLNLL